MVCLTHYNPAVSLNLTVYLKTQEMPTHPSDEYSIRFYLAAPDCAEYYRPEWLDEADRIRLLHHPARAAQTGWRVSRFLKRRAGVFSDGLFSLSHSGGHAVLAVPSVGFAVGVDLERLRERRFDAWPDWVLHEDEARWLQRHSELSDRYALWTLKEALLKATGQALADLPQVGLRRWDGGTDGWRLCAAGKLWRGVVFLLDGEWVCAAVWPQEVAAVSVWQGFGNWRNTERRLLYDFV